MQSSQVTAASNFVLMQKVRDYAQFMKVRLASLVVFSSGVGYLIAAGPDWEWGQFMLLLLGGFLIVGSSNGINQIIERESDQLMKRTLNRPVATGRMSVAEGVILALATGIGGVVIIGLSTNTLSATLALMSLLSYGFVYTPLKRVSSTNTLVGAVPGAIPPVIGWVGAGGAPGWEAWFLFGLLFFWQLPHFIAINWLCRDEYESVGYKMWSNGDLTGRKSGILSAIFALMLAAWSLLPALLGFANLLWTLLGPLLALVMMALAVRFARDGERTSARRLFLFTLLYLPVALLVLTLAWRVRA